MKTNAFLTSIFFVLLVFLAYGYRDGAPPVVIAAHDISYGTLIQESDVKVLDRHWYNHPEWEPKVRGIVGHITVRNIHRGELVKNPGDVLPFAGPVPPGGLSRQQIDSLRN